jgi:putative Holliday junction resolvase
MADAWRRRKLVRILALDVGDRTIGVAVSDELGIAAHPVTVIRRTSLEADLNQLLDLVREYEPIEIVVGLPYRLAGNEGPQAEKVRSFIELLTPRVTVPIITWDERLTTAEAERMLIAADASRARRKKVIDKVAAALILDSYLACKRISSPE